MNSLPKDVNNLVVSFLSATAMNPMPKKNLREEMSI